MLSWINRIARCMPYRTLCLSFMNSNTHTPQKDKSYSHRKQQIRVVQLFVTCQYIREYAVETRYKDRKAFIADKNQQSYNNAYNSPQTADTACAVGQTAHDTL